MASATYNLLNLPEDITMADGNGLSFGYLADGRRVETISSTWYTPLIIPVPGQPPVSYLRYDTEQRFGELTFRDNIPVRYDFKDGYFSLYHLMRNAEPVSPTREVRRRLVAHQCTTNSDSLEVPSLHPYVYIKDHLGSFITAGSGVKADPADKVFQHEYGHYLQSQKFGLLYIPRVAFPSLISASGNGHMRSPVEQDASWRGLNYFYNHIPGFNQWNFVRNPIGEYNLDRTYDYEIVLPKSSNAKVNWFKD